jgi:hypothetical protein
MVAFCGAAASAATCVTHTPLASFSWQLVSMVVYTVGQRAPYRGGGVAPPPGDISQFQIASNYDTSTNAPTQPFMSKCTAYIAYISSFIFWLE